MQDLQTDVPLHVSERRAKTAQPRRRAGVLTWIKRIIAFLIGIFIAAHLYALLLAVVPVPGSVLMTQRMVEGENVRRNMVPLSKISPHMVTAVIAAEDSKFCEHSGVDFDAVKQAFDENQKGGKRRGGSTITQQTAKNVFLWNGGGYVRKAPEAWMALFIDQFWGKRRVMEAYLNIAEFGDGLFGVEAAARVRFGKNAHELTAREAAHLAAILPSPNKWRVDPPGPYVRKRAGTLQARMRVVANEGLADCVLKVKR